MCPGHGGIQHRDDLSARCCEESVAGCWDLDAVPSCEFVPDQPVVAFEVPAPLEVTELCVAWRVYEARPPRPVCFSAFSLGPR